ncbi:hypothetical protein Zmor_009682 [Zophobas morio]|uniref:Uncharacterized protein n=1 Tax=Zophobas morio TaxID=2755281 RepID=A0AA38MIS6_9CUCU|nr:hypothetical protein Zmor_009682 [Zophobas morio]
MHAGYDTSDSTAEYPRGFIPSHVHISCMPPFRARRPREDLNSEKDERTDKCCGHEVTAPRWTPRIIRMWKFGGGGGGRQGRVDGCFWCCAANCFGQGLKGGCVWCAQFERKGGELLRPNLYRVVLKICNYQPNYDLVKMFE